MRSAHVIIMGVACIWMLVLGEVTAGQFVIGILIGSAFVAVTRFGWGKRLPLPSIPGRAARLLVALVVLVPFDVVRSNYRMALRVLGVLPIRPGILRLSLQDLPKAAVAIEEHVITLSPGQIVVDYSADEQTAYIHSIDVEEVPQLRASLWHRYRRLLGEALS
jgi:multicomponent Na+:H+ antiporter subunit E